jgi:hypothetical protein
MADATYRSGMVNIITTFGLIGHLRLPLPSGSTPQRRES